MSVAITSQQPFGSHDQNQMRFYQNAPQFTNPWLSTAQPAHNAFQAAIADPYTQAAMGARVTQMRHALAALPSTNMSMGYQANALAALTIPAAPFGKFAQSQQIDSPIQNFMPVPVPSSAAYETTPLAKQEYAASPPYSHAQQIPQQRAHSFAAMPLQNRRVSHPSIASTIVPTEHVPMALQQVQAPFNLVDRLQSVSEGQQTDFTDELDRAQSMLAMNSDITPRNIYDTTASGRASVDAYGFPTAHSSHSSISSSAGMPAYYGASSISEASFGDYSSASESVGGHSLQSLPNYMNIYMPAAPQTMMSHFSSRSSSGSQKKHKCKICDKRFTRPSSLQTHLYSHTGEKRKLQLSDTMNL